MKRLLRVILSMTLLAVSAIGLVFIVWPRYQELSLLRAQIEASRERLESGQRTLVQLREAEGMVFAHAQDFEKADRAVPKDAGLPVLYEHIQQLGTGGTEVGRADKWNRRADLSGRTYGLL
ncbi:MAG: hypothetical protein UY74_C0071G0006 [Candidatus Kaiserbacteria bacterium GW2011_GWC2_52_8b]|uniref:Uncharacterized protein n=1 Tax=Candidatus Kaiserbacteria bacterium GW2011_GWC2_52_8b TaxID=1618676 RepID=A0A0G1XE31_9BACT|nr:MAG: hypothetical protein UY74_C0071G0006 [Candidatus Kaiserbacteria bacterium GW2011_GWC2_52_8b]